MRFTLLDKSRLPANRFGQIGFTSDALIEERKRERDREKDERRREKKSEIT